MPDRLPLAQADSERCAQVLRVLLSNALRHADRWHDHYCGHLVDDMIEVSVRDTGEGIAPHELPYVFDRFWRGDKSRARETGGSGLGLAIAKQLIEAQGGRSGWKANRVGQPLLVHACRSPNNPQRCYVNE